MRNNSRKITDAADKIQELHRLLVGIVAVIVVIAIIIVISCFNKTKKTVIRQKTQERPQKM